MNKLNVSKVSISRFICNEIDKTKHKLFSLKPLNAFKVYRINDRTIIKIGSNYAHNENIIQAFIFYQIDLAKNAI
jgi:hypothetical protein